MNNKVVDIYKPIKINVVLDDYINIETSLINLISRFGEYIEIYGVSCELNEYNNYYDGSREYKISYQRNETKEETEARIKKYENDKLETERKEREQLEQLKRKYEYNYDDETIKKIDEIKSDIRYEKAEGIHTYHQCEHCNKHAARRNKCYSCLEEELTNLINGTNKDK